MSISVSDKQLKSARGKYLKEFFSEVKRMDMITGVSSSQKEISHKGQIKTIIYNNSQKYFLHSSSTFFNAPEECHKIPMFMVNY